MSSQVSALENEKTELKSQVQEVKIQLEEEKGQQEKIKKICEEKMFNKKKRRDFDSS